MGISAKTEVIKRNIRFYLDIFHVLTLSFIHRINLFSAMNKKYIFKIENILPNVHTVCAFFLSLFLTLPFGVVVYFWYLLCCFMLLFDIFFLHVFKLLIKHCMSVARCFYSIFFFLFGLSFVIVYVRKIIPIL